MAQNSKSVCVVGAGLSGLTAAKCMVDAGFKVICYDENENIGGKWNKNNIDSIPRSVITNVPKTSMCFSDFPPNNYPLYMSADNFDKYLNSYSDYFNLRSIIILGCSVLEIEPEDASTIDTKWKITIKPKCCEGSEVKLFDIVLVCSGFYKRSYIPKNIKQVLCEFKGEIIHSRQFKDSIQYRNKKVIVYGLGNTGGDIACDLSNQNETTHLSTCRGTTVVPRILKDGSIFLNKSKLRLLDYIPNLLQRFFFKYLLNKMLYHIYNQNILGLSSILTSVCLNDLLCMQVLYGKIIIKPEILKTTGRTVFFSNNTFLNDVDTIVLCTGYKRQFSFLSDKVVNIKHKGKFIPLYKNIFYPKFYKSMAFIGMASLNGPYTLMAEMQARYAANVFKGIIKLPDESRMNADIDKAVQYLTHHFNDVKELNFIPGSAWLYFEDLAKGIGCNISLAAIFFTDPKLAWHLFMYRSSFEYRLCGPNSWVGAREAILNESSSLYDYLKGSRNVCKI